MSQLFLIKDFFLKQIIRNVATKEFMFKLFFDLQEQPKSPTIENGIQRKRYRNKIDIMDTYTIKMLLSL